MHLVLFLLGDAETHPKQRWAAGQKHECAAHCHRKVEHLSSCEWL